MARNISFTVAYDGGQYLGWQKTRKGPSVEGCLQGILEQILQESVFLQAASRTDAGVHAQGQVVNFISGNMAIDLFRLQKSLNRMLPKDIVVTEIKEMPIDFHPTLDNIGKEYHYHVCYGPLQMPKERFYSWHYQYTLDIGLMERAVKIFEGEHDFAAFCNQLQKCHYEDTIREITKMEIQLIGMNTLKFVICGSNFLYKMIRNIVGTVVYIGAGKQSIETLPKLLQPSPRVEAGVTAPAHGLTLYKIYF